MFPTPSISSDLDRLTKWASVIARDQVPYATALALTRTGQDVKDAIEREMRDVFDRPTPYTLRGFRLYPARKNNLKAEVWFRPAMVSGKDARDYLGPQVFGGSRKLKAFERSLRLAGLLPDDMNAVPGAAAQLDAYGNMARGQIMQLLSYFKTFTADGFRANITDKRKGAMAAGNARKGQRGTAYFVGRVGDGRGPLGIWQRTTFGSLGTAVKPVIMFVRPGHYKPVLDIQGIAQRIVARRLDANFAQAWQQALASAR